MSKDLIRYDLLVQDALKGVVRKVLGDAAREGLPGDHHFYVSFRTDFPGVRLSQRLREKYPEDMTIVLQHQFYGLEITDVYFQVTLSFKKRLERLRIPFAAISAFVDPAVNFGLQFQVGEAEAAAPASLPPGPGEAGAEPTEAPPGEAGAEPAEKVVSLDAFRKK